MPVAARGFPRCGRCHRDLPWIVESDDEQFPAVAVGASVPVLVDFNAEWCGPCHVMAPIVEQLAGELAGRLKVVKVDVDRAPASAARYGVRSIPTMVLLWQGEERGRLIGAQPAGTLRAWLEERLTTLGQGTEVRK